jgi:hypothetical protein
MNRFPWSKVILALLALLLTAVILWSGLQIDGVMLAVKTKSGHFYVHDSILPQSQQVAIREQAARLDRIERRRRSN